ncbi:MAG TPA: FAD-dependent oxidoreductase [Gemmatimonadaceae bacterium]|jgi:glycine/D-amino acid oxidase-like deaminating enzyme|nr:FAD-dependent oxidoreductase [Gemmatimonadaceae bacterium]
MTNDSSSSPDKTAGLNAARSDETAPAGLPRRDFFKVAGAGAGALLISGAGNAGATTPAPKATRSVRSASTSPDVVVVGAGLWGSFTAYHLRKSGVNVTLVDAYGPGNARSTSGDETRGVRSSYGDKRGTLGELWMLWARESMKRWIQFDDEWGREMRLNLFHVTGDIIYRTEWDNFQLQCKLWWDKNKIPYQVLNPDDVRKAFPVVGMEDITACLYEPDAGVVRARRAAQAAAAAFEHLGGKITIGRATPSKISNGKLEEISLDTGGTLRADKFVYCVGPWLGKTFPDIFAKKTRTPMGYVVYFATPIGDHRFTYPNMPSFNFPGVTGWPALPVDNRGFRVRGAERAPTPATQVADAGAPGAAAQQGRGNGRANNGPTTDTGSNMANAGNAAGAATEASARGEGGGRGGRGAGGRNAGGGGGAAGGGGFGQQQDVPPAQQDPDTSDRWASIDRIDGSRRFVAHRFPILKDAPVAQTHSCHYESTSSNNFIVDWHPQWSNVLIGAGGNAEGAKFAPKMGDYIAQRAMGVVGDKAIADVFKIPDKDFEPPPQTPADSATARGRGGRPPE